MCSELNFGEKNYSEIRKNVFRRDGWRCAVCKSRENLHAHHIIYRSHGGPNELWNLLTLCNRCHDAVHAHKITILGLVDGEPVNANKGYKISIAGR